MSKVTRQKGEKEFKFREQASMLLTACRNFDEGFESAALSIAVCLRTIFHDSKNSKSALTLIGRKNIDMLDSAIYTGEDLNLGLLLKQFSTPYKKKYTVPDTEKHRMRYLPFCHSMVPYGKWRSASKRWVTIEEWLQQDICVNKKVAGAKLNRCDFIKITADRDGGAHIDETIDVNYDYFRFSRSGLNERDDKFWLGNPVMNVPIYPILRQMAFETLYSFVNAGLIKDDTKLIWKEELKKLKVIDEFKAIRLLNASELSPDFKPNENNDDDNEEFSVGKISM